MRLSLFIGVIVALTSVAHAQDEPVVHLWPNGAPGFESRRDIPEKAQDYWVRNVNNPSLTVFLPPKEKATGVAVLVIPGGGHRELVFNAEGRDPGVYLSHMGIAAFALKYRLAREAGSPYTIENACEDARRAMRLIRSRASEWNVDPNRVGILGFSAGGEIVNFISYAPGKGDPNSTDPIERETCKPNFEMLIYPGGLGMPDIVPPDAPPAFMLVANDDTAQAAVVQTMLERYRMAGVSVEAHFLAHGKHAFNMGYRSKLVTVHSWPQRMADWLTDNILNPPGKL